MNNHRRIAHGNLLKNLKTIVRHAQSKVKDRLMIQSAKKELSGREMTMLETQIVTRTQTNPIFYLAAQFFSMSAT